MRILVVEDEVRLARALEQILSEEKYMVDVVHDGEEAVDYGESDIYDVIVLDVMLPKKNGYAVATELRKAKIQTPIIMLTAKDAVNDKVKGLDCGADDYMVKPFSPKELLARIRALTRRQGEVILDEMKFGDLTLLPDTCTLTCGSKNTRLNFKECEVLKLLMSSPGSAVSKEDFILKVWGYDADTSDNNVEAYISFLRKKFAFLGSDVTISTLRKVGYKLDYEEG